MAEMFMQVQVVYRQGVIRTYLAPQGEILMEDFMKVVRLEGKVKTVRFLPDVDRQVADFMVSSGNAVRVEARREKTQG